MKNKFKKGDLVYLHEWEDDIDVIVIILKVNKLSSGTYYYSCMLSDNTTTSARENWLCKSDEHCT